VLTDDEQSIRDLIADWSSATKSGDLSKILPLMAEDVVFLIAGQSPMRGRDAFAAAFQAALGHVRIESTATIQEIRVAGDLAYCWNQLQVTVTPLQSGGPMRRSGYTLTIFRNQSDGRWVVFRDANMLAPETSNT
jgi:uncharacterized protein (TIGR02246 family)